MSYYSFPGDLLNRALRPQAGNRHGDHGHGGNGCGCGGAAADHPATPNACCHPQAEESPCPCPHSCSSDYMAAQAQAEPPQVCCKPAAFHATRDTVGGYHNIHVAYGTTRPAY